MHKVPLLVSAALWFWACAHRPVTSAANLVQAAKDIREGNATARTQALGGFHEWLITGDAKSAEARFDAAVALNPKDPLALWGSALLARRSGDFHRALELCFTLLDSAPEHPLSSLGARYIAESVGQASATDENIAAFVLRQKSRALGPEVAFLLRGAELQLALHRGDVAATTATLADMGIPTEVTHVGPFSPYRLLDFDVESDLEKGAAPAVLKNGPLGEVSPRTLRFPDGRWTLAGEPEHSHGHVFAVDIEVTQGAWHWLRTASPASHRVSLDGVPVLSRRGFQNNAPVLTAKAVWLKPGVHRLVARLFRDERAMISVALPRADGKPAGLRFRPAKGAAANMQAHPVRDATQTWPTASSLEQALRDENGTALAAFLAAHDALSRDPEGAERLLATLQDILVSPAISVLRAQVALSQRNLPPRLAQGRATRELEQGLSKDPTNVEALLARANLSTDEQRLDEAGELLQRARAAASPVGWPVALAEARLGLALQVDAQAEVAAQEALKIQPGLCEAQSLLFELASRKDAIARAEALLDDMKGCPGALLRRLEHLRQRGRQAQALEIAEQLAAREPTSPAAAMRLVSLYLSLDQQDNALRTLDNQRAQWPLNAELLRRRADVLTRAGRPAHEALAANSAALELDGGDLSLRRTVERAKTGRDVLDTFAIDTQKAISAYNAFAASHREEAAAVFVLDSAVMQAFPNGSTVDRIHVIQKVLDASAISELAEVDIPEGAQVLKLRTLKADGRMLYPETIDGKDAISLPNVSVGDFVEYEYLLAHPSRGPLQPGFTASNFYFQIARQPDHWATYTVLAPKGSGLAVDAHNLRAPATEVWGDHERFSLTLREMPAFIPEPDSPPSGTETIPFVSVGFGAKGQEGLMHAYGEIVTERSTPTFELEVFAKAAAAGQQGEAAARAIHAAVMTRISGRDGGLNPSASTSFAGSRGSRLLVMKAALEAVGLPARVALVRPFSVDPAPYLFPNETLFPYGCLRVTLPGGKHVWLDTVIRNAPFGELPEQVAGEREAYLLPEPSRPLERVTTPTATPSGGKRTDLELALDAEGNLSGTGTEHYQGIEAAQLLEALDAIAPTEREQTLQNALSRYFPGGELSGLRIDATRVTGGPVKLHYQLKATKFARREGDRWLLPPVTFPAELGKRYVQLAKRRSPLFMGTTEKYGVAVRLKLPRGFSLFAPIGQISAGGVSGQLRRNERQIGDVVHIDEWLWVPMARIPPDRYEDFSQFAGEVDLLQSRELVLVPQASAPSAAR
ncbi:MAG: hypothetical protein ACKVPX_13970 [Myxococcaceae bacterium]